MNKIRITVQVFVPEGRMCQGCRFLIYSEGGEMYRCTLWMAWDLSEDQSHEVRSEENCYKCWECREACGKGRVE